MRHPFLFALWILYFEILQMKFNVNLGQTTQECYLFLRALVIPREKQRGVLPCASMNSKNEALPLHAEIGHPPLAWAVESISPFLHMPKLSSVINILLSGDILGVTGYLKHPYVEESYNIYSGVLWVCRRCPLGSKKNICYCAF